MYKVSDQTSSNFRIQISINTKDIHRNEVYHEINVRQCSKWNLKHLAETLFPHSWDQNSNIGLHNEIQINDLVCSTV